MEESPLLSSTYLSSLAYSGGFFHLALSPSQHTFHAERNLTMQVFPAAVLPKESRTPRWDCRQSSGPDGSGGIITVWKQRRGIPVLSAVAGKRKMWKSIKPTPPKGTRPHPSPTQLPAHFRRPAFSLLTSL